MRKEYREILKKLETRLIKAEAFAKRVPVFANIILERKLTGEEDYEEYAKSYKTLYCAWGINRGFFDSKSDRNISNYEGEYSAYLFHIYINTLVIYDSYAKFGLDEICEKVDLFFYDGSNNTFYATDDQIGSLLDALAEWKEEAVKKIGPHKKQKELEKLRKQVAELEKETI